MTLRTRVYAPAPAPQIIAVQIAEDNIYDVAQWSGGEIKGWKSPGREYATFILLPFLSGAGTGQYGIGDWIGHRVTAGAEEPASFQGFWEEDWYAQGYSEVHG